jgi:periplasmic protein TonB
MSETATLRATSLLASAGILGGLVIVALTFTYALPTIGDPYPETLPFDVVREPPPPPPQPEPTRQPLRVPTNVTEPMETILPAEPDPRPTEISEIGPPFVAEEITDPRWLRRPRDLQRYYPRAAITRGVEGVVVLDCLVAVTGDLRCAVVSETPREWGFGAAALRIAAEHRMEPARRDGTAVEGRYRMRVPFRTE